MLSLFFLNLCTTRQLLPLPVNLMVSVHVQPLMLIVPDVQDVYTPLETDIIVQLSEVSFGPFVLFLCYISCLLFLRLVILISFPFCCNLFNLLEFSAVNT